MGVAAMRDLICHYCGGPCEMNGDHLYGGEVAYVACRKPECQAAGPGRPTPELAAAHLSVMPAVVKTTEGPKVPGWHWVFDAGEPSPTIVFVHQFDIDRGLYVGTVTAGPIPLPLEPGEGGGA
jgi:hypothetical protein